MRRMRLLWYLFTSYLLITLFALLAVTWGTWGSLRQFYFSQTKQDLAARAQLVSGLVADHLRSNELSFIDSYCKDMGKHSPTRLTVILPSGQVIGDSEHAIASMANHRDRPEIQQALAGNTGEAMRESATLHEAMMYVAMPVVDNGHIVAVLRTAIPLTAYNQALDRLHRQLLIAVLVIALLATLISLWLSRRISYPLEDARRAADRFAQGNLDARLPVTGPVEIAGLAQAMNEMAQQLDERIRTILRQRNEQEAVLSSMIEGVMAFDQEECILRMNQAAATLLGLDVEKVKGRSLQETVRNSDLQRFVATILANHAPQEAKMLFRLGAESRWIQLHGTLLHDESEQSIGALVVMHDITRLNRLETVRRDFVANVSHELKTPITSIKGFVETLIDGSLNEPAETERFLRIIARHADRMNEIIEDLLVLSSLEQQDANAGITLESTNIHDVLEVAMQACVIKAGTKDISLLLSGEENLIANVDAALLEQAMVNLIDNAIKYSPDGSVVIITLLQREGEILIQVDDQGYGIATEHLARIFERFYRVDAGRSRKLGGTGLGLAIVKHIVQAHQGYVTVESKLGLGSNFTIHLPNTSLLT